MPREQAHTALHQWTMPDGRIATTVHFVDDDGNEKAELTGIHQKLELSIEDRGHEIDLPERARKGAR